MKVKEEFVLQITETGRGHLKVHSESFNVIVEYFKTKEALKDYLVERYGRLPKGRNKIYNEIGFENPVQIGFTYSFWNQDISHASKKWYQTDWICFSKRTTTEEYFKL